MKNHKPNVLAVISARGGSKGVPGKNLKTLGDRPLLAYVCQKAAAVPSIDRVICSTDSVEIAEVAKQYGAEIPALRPPELSGDSVPLIDVTQYMMRELDKEGWRADIVVQLAPTCPFMRPFSIESAIKDITELDCDCVVSLKRIEHEHPYRARVISDTGYFENFIQDINVEAIHSRQDLPDLYCTTGGLYARKRKLLDDYDGSDFALGEHRKALVFDDIESTNIDRLIDFQMAEFLIDQGYAKDYI